MIEVYSKRQRSKRKDPQQESIVSEKDTINERTSKLISLIRAMKSGWNGGPSPEIGVEKFNLTQPMPDSVVSSGDVAVHELSEIVQLLRNIKTMQDSYSTARNQRAEQLKQVQPVQQVPVATSSYIEDSLLKFASNPLTRVWSNIIAYNPFVSENNRGQRISLLNSLGRIDNNLQEIEDKILSMDESSILDSIFIAKQLYSDAKSSFFSTFRKNVDNMLSQTNKELEELSAKITKPVDNNFPTGQVQEVSKNQQAILSAIQHVSDIVNDGYKSEPEIPIETPTPLTTTPVKIPNINTEPKVEQEESVVKDKKKTTKRKPRKKKKIQVAPVIEEPVVTSDDFQEKELDESQQLENYKRIANYLYTNINSLVKDSEVILNKQFLNPWKDYIKKTYAEIINLGKVTIEKIYNGQDYEDSYESFLKSVGLLKSIDYIAEVEVDAIEKDPDIEPGSMFDEDDLKIHALNFAESQLSQYQQIIDAKISQASNAATRFIKRMITHIIPRKDRTLRLTVSRNIRQARKGLEGMMDLLEDRHLNFGRLISLSDLFFEYLTEVYEGLADLADMYNSAMRMEKSYRKQHNSKMTYDFIPTTDINALRNIQRNLEQDNANLQILQDVESALLQKSQLLEKQNG